MITAYIAGPYRSRWGLIGRAWNILQAWLYGRRVARIGAFPVVPHTGTAFYDGLQPDEFFLDGTLQTLKRCDVIVMMPTWRTSAGSRSELAWAEANDMPVFYDVSALARWMADRKVAALA